MLYVTHNSKEFDEAWEKVMSGDQILIVVDDNPSYKFYFNTVKLDANESNKGCCC